MDTNFENIKNIILEFENEKISLHKAIKFINDETNKSITEYDLLNYWRSQDLDNFVNRLIAKPLNWEEIDDQKALELIQEILDNIGDDAIFDVNSEALEKKYSKVSGAISNWIFYDNINNPDEILEKLKKDTTLLL